MATQQIGWSVEAKLLNKLSQQMEQLIKVTGALITTTTTTTVI